MKTSFLVVLTLLIGVLFSESVQQSNEFLGLYYTADQEWAPAPSVFGLSNVQLKNKVNGYAFYADGSIKRNLATLSPEHTIPSISKLEEPENWGTWRNGPKNPDGLGYVIANWSENPTINDTLVVYPTPKREAGYTLEGSFMIYFSLFDQDVYSQSNQRDYVAVEFKQDGTFGLKAYNTFMEKYDNVPFKPEDQGQYRIKGYTITFEFSDGGKSSTCFAHLPPTEVGGSSMLFLANGYGFMRK